MVNYYYVKLLIKNLQSLPIVHLNLKKKIIFSGYYKGLCIWFQTISWWSVDLKALDQPKSNESESMGNRVPGQQVLRTSDLIYHSWFWHPHLSSYHALGLGYLHFTTGLKLSLPPPYPHPCQPGPHSVFLKRQRARYRVCHVISNSSSATWYWLWAFNPSTVKWDYRSDLTRLLWRWNELMSQNTQRIPGTK